MPQAAAAVMGPSALELSCAVFKAAADVVVYAMQQEGRPAAPMVVGQVNHPAFLDLVRQVSKAWRRSSPLYTPST